MAYVPEINDKNGLSGDIHPRFRHGPFFHNIVKKKASSKPAHELGGFFDDVWAGVKTGLTGGARETANAVAASVSKAAIASLQKKNAAKARAVQPPPAEAPVQEPENPASGFGTPSALGTPVDYTRYIPYALAGVGGLVLIILIARRRS
jgi:hypothetical protein